MIVIIWFGENEYNKKMAKDYNRITGFKERVSEACVETQLELDKLIYGVAYFTKDSDGNKIRIDPRSIVIMRNKKPTLWQRIKRFFCRLVSHGTMQT